MATIYGAEAIGLGKITGSLEVGKEADIIIIDTDKPHLVPMYNPVSHLVYAVSGSDVRDVFVSGKQVVSNHVVLTLDTAAVMNDVRKLSEKIMEI